MDGNPITFSFRNGDWVILITRDFSLPTQLTRLAESVHKKGLTFLGFRNAFRRPSKKEEENMSSKRRPPSRRSSARDRRISSLKSELPKSVGFRCPPSPAPSNYNPTDPPNFSHLSDMTSSDQTNRSGGLTPAIQTPPQRRRSSLSTRDSLNRRNTAVKERLLKESQKKSKGSKLTKLRLVLHMKANEPKVKPVYNRMMSKMIADKMGNNQTINHHYHYFH